MQLNYNLSMNADLGFILTVAVWCTAGGTFFYYRRQVVRKQRPTKH